jgi:methionyl-tRNA synthetase
MPEKFYLTTPIYYVNDKPHIGHAYTTIAADVLARHYRKKEVDTFFLTGTDEHGAKIAEAAEKNGKEPQQFVDDLVPVFQNAWEKLNISYDGFIRTTNPDHEKVVRELIEKVEKNGYIEKRKYEGLYCIGCERYFTKDELVDGKCPDHKREPVLQSEENYFFLLSKAAKDFDLAGKIKKDLIKVRPQTRKNEVLGKINAGLEDVSISRENVAWGISFPGDEKQTIYVWIDALINYYSATKMFEKGAIWPANLHLMAKDILWFHAVIWPAFLLAAGLDTPKEVFAHGFFTINGEKMSKSLGNIIDPIAEVEKYGNPDVLRYALLREFPFGEDGDISEEKIEARYNGDLANGLGNLVNRVLTIVEKNYDSKVPDVEIEETGKTIKFGNVIFSGGYQTLVNLQNSVKYIEELKFEKALGFCMGFGSETQGGVIPHLNRYIEHTELWKLVKLDKKAAGIVIYDILEVLRALSIFLYPFIPDTSSKVLKALGYNVNEIGVEEAYQWGILKPGSSIEKPEPLFPRLEK